jgi:hypothetical protein
MKRWMGGILFLAMAGSLAAQTLTIGSTVAGVGQTYSTVLNVTLASQTKQIASMQFDVAYDTTQLTVVIAAGSSATAGGKTLTSNMGPACAPPAECPPLAANAQRVIIAGGSTGGSSPQDTIFADGVVATLTITVNTGATNGVQPLTFANLAGSDASANAITLTGVNGSVTVSTSYAVGDVYPFTKDTAPNFGDGQFNVLDLVQELFAVNSIPGFVPAPCSDRLDSMDSFPKDTATARGGDGTLNILDLVAELFRVDNLDLTRPVRPSLGGCAAPQSFTAQIRTRPPTAPAGLAINGVLVLEAAQSTGPSSEQVPVYLEAARDMVNVAVTFGVGDQASPLRFQAAGTAPSLLEDRQLGVVAAAWTEGITVPAGGRLLLGYVAGPAGMSANLKVYGVSASGLDNGRELRLGTSARKAPR